MVALTKAFTVIPDADVDPDSPVTTTLMTQLRDNDIHLEEWLGLSATVKIADHAHAGFAVDGTKVISQVALVFDQSTGNSASIAAGAGAVDIATITVAAADLPSNRDAMIIASGDADPKGNGGDLKVRFEVDGVVKQTVDVFSLVSTSGEKDAWALSEIVNLTSGAARTIKVQGVSTAVGADVANTNLFSVLIT